jgi:hypothetical protein
MSTYKVMHAGFLWYSVEVNGHPYGDTYTLWGAKLMIRAKRKKRLPKVVYETKD